MHDIDRDLDTNGDVLFILQRPNGPFAVWKEDNGWKRPGPHWPWPEPEALHNNNILEYQAVDPAWLKRKSSGDSQPAQSRPFRSVAAPVQAAKGEATPSKVTSDQRPDVRFRLSSKHLMSASPVFNAMLNGKWKESDSTPDPYYVLHSTDWDVEALQIIMDIIHGRSQKVPRSVTLEMLAKIAVLVDYYNCHDAVRFFSDTWIAGLQEWTHPTPAICRESILRLCTFCVFNKAEDIEEVLHIVVREVRGPLQTLGLPLPGSMIGMFLCDAKILAANIHRLY